MPIHCPLTIRPLSDEEFSAIDRSVMACAYASQNELGRLCEERVYENDVAARLRSLGFTEVHTQVPVTVSHGSFSKTYRLDMVGNQMVYEFKTAVDFVAEHDLQGIHYAVLLSVDRVKLLNFRTAKVTGRLKRAPLFAGKQRDIRMVPMDWRPLSDRCDYLRNQIMELLQDWGAFLEARLYEEALVHFCGGETACVVRLPLSRAGIPLGHHRMACHSANLGFVITAMTAGWQDYREHLLRLVRFTGLRGIQWLNLSHAELQLVTIENSKSSTTPK